MTTPVYGNFSERIPFPYLCANKQGKDTITNREVHNWYKYRFNLNEDPVCYNLIADKDIKT